MAKKPKTPEAEGEEGEAKPGGVKGLLANKMVLIGLVGMLAAGVGGGAWMFLGKKKDAADPALEAAKAVQKRTGFIEMKEMLINISGSQPGERSNFIKLKVALEISDSKMAPEIQPLLPRVEDMFQVYLRELRPPTSRARPAPSG